MLVILDATHPSPATERQWKAAGGGARLESMQLAPAVRPPAAQQEGPPPPTGEEARGPPIPQRLTTALRSTLDWIWSTLPSTTRGNMEESAPLQNR